MPMTAKRHMERCILASMKGRHLTRSPSHMGGLHSAASAPLLSTRAELVTLAASTVPSLPVKAHVTTLLADGWSCLSPSGDRFLWQGTPGDKQQKEWKTKAYHLGQWVNKWVQSLYLLQLMTSSASLVANSAVLSSLSWFPQRIQSTLRGWGAGVRVEERRGAAQTQHMTGEEHLSPSDSTQHTAPSLST